jgi:hypothetical protein
MPLVAVAPNRHGYGVESTADDWRAPPGDDRNGRVCRPGVVGVETRYEVMDLTNALAREYATDAHLVAYVLRDPRGASSLRQPRINKNGLGFVRSLGYSVTIEVLFADVDNPAHTAWTPELLELARAQDAKLATAGVYYTAHGRRVVQPLTRPVFVEDAEGVLAAWLRQLQALGMHVDEGCQDWTRHFRLPHVRRNGRFARAEIIELGKMMPIDPPRPAPLLGRRRSTRATIDFANALDTSASPLARAFEVAGWLGPELGRGKRAALCPFREEHTIGRDFDSSTVIFGATPSTPLGWWWCSHGHCTRRTQDEAIGALPPAARTLLEDAAKRAPAICRVRELVSKEAARPLLEAAFRCAPAGASCVIAGCGTGKTEAAIEVACEAAETEGASKRAPAGSKTSISVPTTKLSREVYERIRARGVAVRRIFGPLSVRREDGTPECAIHECASAFSRGGLSVPWELCEGRGKAPCEFADTCKARGGTEGPEDARIVVGPHKLLSRLDGAAGKTGLLVIDEPPPLLANEVLTSEELSRCAEDLGRYFESRYAAALVVSLRAIAGWVQTGPLERPGPLADGVVSVDPVLLELALDATGAESAVGAAKLAFDEPEEGGPRRSTSPPVQRQYAAAARRALYIARAIGEASRVARIVWLALTCEPGGAVARIEERNQRRVLVVTLPDVQLREAMRREGRVVVADAGGRQHLPIYRLVVGYDLPVTEVHAGDGAEIRRTHLKRRASRAGWMRHGRLVVDASLVRSVDLAVSWLLEEPTTARAALVTFKALELALRAALGEDVTAAWLAMAQEDESDRLRRRTPVLEQAVKLFGRSLQRLPRPPDMGHYGAVRGLDHWREHDALVTLGDPWPQLGDARWEGELLKIPHWERRLEEAARGELEQAHGRLRTVHRTTPARALHVGALRPGGWDGLGIDVRDDQGGRQRAASPEDVRAAVERAGSLRGAAKALGVGRSSVQRALRPA